jgi:hypothetical protein
VAFFFSGQFSYTFQKYISVARFILDRTLSFVRRYPGLKDNQL